MNLLYFILFLITACDDNPVKTHNCLENECHEDSGNDHNEVIQMYDYHFIRDKYFFIDEIFKSNYYPLNDNYINTADPYYVIKDFKLYKLSSNHNVMYYGNAYINPLNTDEGELYNIEDCYWVELDNQDIGSDYYIDKYYGYVRLGNIQSSDVIAVHYTLGQVNFAGQYSPDIVESEDPIITGTQLQDICLLDNIESCIGSPNPCTQEELAEGLYCEYIELNWEQGYQNNPLILKIIKTAATQVPPSAGNDSGNPTWKLMMKNVYSIGLSSLYPGDEVPEIEIIHTGGQLGTETTSSNGNSFLKIFGIDNKNSDGALSVSGDGKVDRDFINGWGDLVLPFDMPFAYDINNYLGNPHPDLEHIFDTELELCEQYNIIFERLSGITETVTGHRCNDGPAMYYSNNQEAISSELEFKIQITLP